MLSQTSVTEFLLGVTDIQELQPVLFVVFLATYFVSLAGNGAILMVVISDSRLHSPMYYFLGNLSCLDICYSTVTLPKMLENFLSTHKTISFLGCISQLHFFHFLGSTESMLLAMMAFDCFVAICKPFYYTLIMSHQFCIQMAVTICPLLELACGNTELNEWLLNTVTGTIATGSCFLTFLSYFYIIIYLFFKTHSCSMLHKALSTCASYFLAVILFHIPGIFVYIHPASSSSMDQDQIIAVMYRVVTPMLNPLIYTLRNKEVKGALRRVM
uniref:G-protein coupled receptors family 1 profile domain-containing protein n=1 Tax=Capra hircus TaxID=9925 RepID=A0A452E2J4_CAPHI